jgi:hypothetical protein
MTNHNPENERTKRAYFAFLKEPTGTDLARLRSASSIEGLSATLISKSIATSLGPSGSPHSTTNFDPELVVVDRRMALTTRESTFGRCRSRRLFYEFTSDIHFTVMVIFLDTTGGLNG